MPLFNRIECQFVNGRCTEKIKFNCGICHLATSEVSRRAGAVANIRNTGLEPGEEKWIVSLGRTSNTTAIGSIIRRNNGPDIAVISGGKITQKFTK